MEFQHAKVRQSYDKRTFLTYDCRTLSYFVVDYRNFCVTIVVRLWYDYRTTNLHVGIPSTLFIACTNCNRDYYMNIKLKFTCMII